MSYHNVTQNNANNKVIRNDAKWFNKDGIIKYNLSQIKQFTYSVHGNEGEAAVNRITRN